MYIYNMYIHIYILCMYVYAMFPSLKLSKEKSTVRLTIGMGMDWQKSSPPNSMMCTIVHLYVCIQ